MGIAANSETATTSLSFIVSLPADESNCQKDSELLELGEQLASVQPKLVGMLRWVDEVRDLLATEARRRGSWPEDTAEWTWRDAAAYCGRARMR
jgi:hypothetical protein